MLWVHIGSPKTGTTSLQEYLWHADGTGFRYMRAGRGPRRRMSPSHNRVYYGLERHGTTLEEAAAHLEREHRRFGHLPCVVSSEMFYGRPLARWAPFLSRIPNEEIAFLVYLRRPDLHFEASYKQKAKNGRTRAGVDETVDEWLTDILADPAKWNMSRHIGMIEAGFPGARIVPRLFGGDGVTDTVADACALIGLDPKARPRSERANVSLSRAASDAVGEIASRHGVRTARAAARKLSAIEEDCLRGRYDVLEWEERTALLAACAERNEALRAKYFPEREALFESPRPTEGRGFRRNAAREVEKAAQARALVARMAGVRLGG